VGPFLLAERGHLRRVLVEARAHAQPRFFVFLSSVAILWKYTATRHCAVKSEIVGERFAPITPLSAAMQPEMLPLNAKAFLVQHKDGWIYVVFDGHLYARAEMVPLDIVVKGPRPETIFSAETFVRASMIEQFGNEIEMWPSLARHFLDADLTARLKV
jgi:hypothetical protein